jgi:uncharacterized protein
MGRKLLAALTTVLILSLALNAFLTIIVLRYQERVRSLEEVVQTGGNAASASLMEWSWINVVAVSQDNTGVVLRVYAKIENGSGRIYMATTPRVGIDLQSSAETAYKVAGEICHFNIQTHDLFIVVVANFTVDIVDGPSAGAAITVLVASIMTGRYLNNSVIMTGTIEPDGTIGKVGGIVEKAIAAAQAGAKLFIVPKGQTTTTIYVEHKTRIGPFTFITREPQIINVQEYLKNQSYTIKIVEVSTIQEAINYFFT